MNMCFSILLLALGILASCQQSPRSTAYPGEPGIDPVSRNVLQKQGGSVRDPSSLAPPPIRPDLSAGDR